ncbi:hypothetical protein IT157_10575 [bacterium]|nr:hypothetical protein [bacterium]
MSYIVVKESNRDILTHDTSGLSVALARGALDPRAPLIEINSCLARKKLNERQTAYLLGVKRQLIFREFARSALEVQQFVFPRGAKTKSSKEYKILTQGSTGIPIIDASIRALKKGLPHNRARLLLARFAIRNLNLAPELVADFYRTHLTDYSPVINTFNIVSASSAANFSEPSYRLSNPLTAAKKLDPADEFVRRFGFASQEADTAGEKLIQNGNILWKLRWQAAHESGDFIRRKLWPTRDSDHGIYFILDRIPARGAVSPYYNHYLKREDELIST